jgi:TonB dependent receptor
MLNAITRAAAFYQTSDNLQTVTSGILLPLPSGALLNTSGNVGNSAQFGIELSAKTRCLADGTGSAGYSPRLVQDHFLHDQPTTQTGVDFAHTTPRQVVDVRGGWSNGKWELDAAARYQSTFDGLVAEPDATFTAVRIDNYLTLDARVAYRDLFGGRARYHHEQPEADIDRHSRPARVRSDPGDVLMQRILRLAAIMRVADWPFALKMGICPALAMLALIGLAAHDINATFGQVRLIRTVVNQDLTRAGQLASSATLLQQINSRVYRLTTLQAAHDPDLAVDREAADLVEQTRVLITELTTYAAASAGPDERTELTRLIADIRLYHDAIAVVGSMLAIDFPSAVELIKPFDGIARNSLAALETMRRQVEREAGTRAQASATMADRALVTAGLVVSSRVTSAVCRRDHADGRNRAFSAADRAGNAVRGKGRSVPRCHHSGSRRRTRRNRRLPRGVPGRHRAGRVSRTPRFPHRSAQSNPVP